LAATLSKHIYDACSFSISERSVVMPTEVNIEDVDFEYEFSDVQGFECDPDDSPCGTCCSMQFNVTFSEINRINGFLKSWLQSQEFKGFVLDHLTYLGTSIAFTTFFLEKMFEKYRRGLETFFKPSLFVPKGNVLYVTHYRLSTNRVTGYCLFYNAITYQCAAYSVRPQECRIYPFNFEYDFQKDKKIKVFIVEKCEGLESVKPIEKSSLESAIKEYVTNVIEHNKMLQKCGERNNVSLHMPLASFEKREIRCVHKDIAQITQMLEKTDISKKTTKSKIRDLFLEEQMISCLNEDAYKSYLSQVQKGKIVMSDWI